MFGFFRTQKAEVLDHWIAFIDNFQTSSAEFYSAIEAELAVRKVPGLEMSRVEFAEGGVLSAKRLYLRMIRERLVFDVCAAPFGTGSFFSCRFAEIPATVTLLQMIGLFFILGALFVLLSIFLTPLLGPFVFLGLLALIVWTGRNAVSPALKDLDQFLIRLPAIGAFYERYLRAETYYRQDTRLMYLDIVSGLVKKLAEEVTAAKGVKLIRQYEQAPILGELYKPVPLSPAASPPVAPPPGPPMM